jgi:hypothetical protein
LPFTVTFSLKWCNNYAWLITLRSRFP